MNQYPFLVPDTRPGAKYSQYIDDVAAQAEFALSHSTAAYCMCYKEDLEEMIAMKTWRSPAAAEVLARILRGYAQELSMSEDQQPERAAV
jgi:hypothetical protein